MPRMPYAKRKPKAYTREDLINAVSSITMKRLTYREASRMYNVPKATLVDKIKERVPLFGGKPGWWIHI